MKPVWSEEALRIHQRQWDASLSLDDFVASYPRSAQKALKAVLEGAIEYGESWDIDLPFDSGGGEQIWIRSMGRALWVDGKVIRLFGAFQDITGPKVVEQQLNRGAHAAGRARKLGDVNPNSHASSAS